MVWPWVAGVAVVLLVMLISSNVKVSLKVVRKKNNDDIVLDIQGVFGLVKKRFEVPVIIFKSFSEGVGIKTEYVDKTKDEVLMDAEKKITKRSIKEAFDIMRNLLSHCFQFNEWLLDTLKHVHCTRVVWKTNVGVGDAAETALTTGMVWGLKTSLLGFLFRFIKLDTRPEIMVIPQFNEVKFSTEVLCLARIRMYFILLAGLHLLFRIIKIKDGWRTWQRVLFKA
ncbi:DUF2953 domain-containing protein [Paenibacillus sp. LMG 31456]|uniref:DUF2953 domain-containing protein n=1 Tax=Paenibacillus foliorum TaxID=2654974 RepID=A0A972H2T0_9BACL|nr:DUF2953 domain-containing protein [Paenibacillus foliorum]NOU97605.1 DUF2953 domain-containing protein [Paenibacillus foliorum]